MGAETEEDPYFQSYVQNFLLSAQEIVQTLEQDILALEAAPGDTGRVHAVFRAFHTLKGGARGAKWEELADFAHRIETLLSRLRDGELQISADLVSLLLRGVDMLPLFLAAAQGGAAPDPAEIAAILAELEPFIRVDQTTEQQETREAIRSIRSSLGDDLPLFVQQPDGEWVGDCYRGFDIIQLAAGAAGLQDLAGYATQVADLLIPIENGSREITVALAPVLEEVLAVLELLVDTITPPTPACNQRIDRALAALRSYPDPLPPEPPPPEPQVGARPLGEILLEQQLVSEQDLLEGLNKQRFLGDILVQEGKLSEENRDHALSIQAQQLEQSIRDAAVTIRVDVTKLNRLLNLVGALGYFHGNLDQALANMEQLLEQLSMAGNSTSIKNVGHALLANHTALSEIAHQGELLTRTLQAHAVTLRMIPVGGLLHSFQRLIRDAARQTGKLVRLEIRGAETEVDKNIVEKLSDPFKHLLRNAIDHGIEKPEQRQAEGKPPFGTLLLHAFHQGGQVCIDIQDDGHGIELPKVLEKARQKGWVKADETLSEAAVLELLFRPGLSTANEVTELSGRGVGLDVVRQEIAALHGTIRIRQQLGQGTRFRIQLPLTLAIVDGVIVRVGQQSFIVPTLSILESFRADPILWQATEGELAEDRLPWRGEFVPLLHLDRLLGIEHAHEPQETATILVVSEAGRRAGLLVDETLEQKQLLIKNLEEHFYPVPGIMGASVLDDGRVILILDMAWLLRQAG
ncbi:MAG: chemotaxis protein CheA [Magnetococcales bacterium]|nr:chemotaxis protein CheA [Magnetococcales bacterium]